VRTLHTRGIRAIELIGEGFLASGGDDKRLFIWDLERMVVV